MNADNRETKNRTRRSKRLQRRQYERFRERRDELRSILLRSSLLPENIRGSSDEAKTFNAIDNPDKTPYELRKEGLKKSLEPHQFGRVILHLHKRRGFRSNSGAKLAGLHRDSDIAVLLKEIENQDGDSGANDHDDNQAEESKDRGLALGGIKVLLNAMKPNQTLGEFIYEYGNLADGKTDTPRRVRKLAIDGIELYAHRDMLEYEFDRLWEAQAKFHSELTDALRAEVRTVLLHQLPLKSQKHTVGFCSLEPKARRAPVAALICQQARYLQDLNNLFSKMPEMLNFQSRALRGQAFNDSQLEVSRRALTQQLETTPFISWADVKTATGLPARFKLNLENMTSKKGLVGNKTACAIRAVCQEWDSFAAQTINLGASTLNKQDALVNELLGLTGIQDKAVLFRRLTNAPNNPHNPWRFDAMTALKLATLELEDGYHKHSFKALEKLLPHLKNSAIYDKAVTGAGYKFSDQSVPKPLSLLPAPLDVANPLVQKALHETRRVVNALLCEHGKPNLIRIELGRDLKASKEHRKRMEEQQNQNQKRNERAVEKIREHKAPVTAENIMKHKLWVECGERSAYCTNGDGHICLDTLFSPEIEIDHIYPRSRSADNSYANKVICLRRENTEKGDRTPYEAWHGTERFEFIRQRLANLANQKDALLSKGKLHRILNPDFEAEEFIGRQLSDTRYIAKMVKNYLVQLGIPIEITTGAATHELGHLWGIAPFLDGLMKEFIANQSSDNGTLPEDEDTDGRAQPAQRIKKSRADHRHHAVDALVTALTDRERYRDLQARYRCKEQTGRWPDHRLDEPWEGFGQQARNAISNLIVSHQSNYRLRGAMHKETAFAKRAYFHPSVRVNNLGAFVKWQTNSDTYRALSFARLNNKGKKVWTTLERTAGHGCWIHDATLAETFWRWVDQYPEAIAKPQKYPPLEIKGQPVEHIVFASHCFVSRAPINECFKAIFNEPGRGGKSGWICQTNTREGLRQWAERNAGKGTSKKEREKALGHAVKNKDYPVIGGHRTQRVQIAFEADDDAIVQAGGKYYEAEDYHHVEIFRRPLANDATPEQLRYERRGLFVRRFEALQRQRNKRPVINRTPDSSWGEGWGLEMWLAKDDPVLNNKTGLLYRVQKMSAPNNSVTLRPHFVTSSHDKDSPPLILRATINSLDCSKMRVDQLGRVRPLHEQNVVPE